MIAPCTQVSRNLVVECEDTARDQLGLKSDRGAAITNPGQGE